MAQELSNLAWAIKYAKLGWKIFPLSTGNDRKRPHAMLGKEDGHKLATTDIKTIRAWWTRSPNAGIGLNLADSGLIAVDTDPKDGGPGKLKALEETFGELNTPVQSRTGSGGTHYLYSAPAGIRPPGKLKGEKGIDLKYNGYIVLPPSSHSTRVSASEYKPTGKFYAWKPGASPFGGNDALIPPMPDWFLDRAVSTERVAPRQGSGDDVFIEDAQKCGLDVAEIVDLLDLVPNDGTGDEELTYDDWFNVLSGIWHETDGSTEGRSIALAWSEQSPKHDPDKFNRTWPSLDHHGKGRPPLTLRYLIKLASAAKNKLRIQAAADLLVDLNAANSATVFREVCQRIKQTELDPFDRRNFAAEVQKRYKALTGNVLPIGDARSMIRYEDPNGNVVPAWLKPWIYVASEDQFLKRGTTLALTKYAFDSMFNHRMMTRQEIAEGKAFPEMTASNAALNRYEIPRAERRMYLPGEDAAFTMNGTLYFNTFSDQDQPPVPPRLRDKDVHAIETLERHFEYLIPVPRDRAIFISWLAYIVQTQKRSNWAIVYQSPEGEGKTFFAELMGAILGASNVKILDSNVIRGDFTGWAAGHLLKIVEEIKLHGAERFDILDNIKQFITNSVINVHAKTKEPVDVVNTAGYLMFTNYRDALPVVEGDTRYFLLASPRQSPEAVKKFKEQNPNYFTNLFSIISEAPGALRYFFLNYTLHHEFSPTGRAPPSTEKAYVASLNRSEAEILVRDLIAESGSPLFTTTLFDATLMLDQLSTTGLSLHGKAIESLMARLGFSFLGRIRFDGRYRRFWSQSPALFGETDDDVSANIRLHLSNAAWANVADL